MKIVATIEVQIPSPDEESRDQMRAFEELKRRPEEMIERIYQAIDSPDSSNYGIHSPEIEEGDI